jgi:hypothetical protein
VGSSPISSTEPSPNGVQMPKSSKDPAPRLLSGGNPQIPKGEGPEVVRSYIEAMPDWKRPIGEHVHDLITSTVPDVHMAVKWNQPFFGNEGDGWFMAFRCFTRYVQLQFFRGTSLDPEPPKASKHPEVRYLDIHEDDDIDDELIVSWIEQASRLPGEHV